MSFIYGFLFLLFCTMILTRILYDGPIKLAMIIILPFAAYHWFSTWYSVFCFGFCLVMGLGNPINMEDRFNASGLRRLFGTIFELIGIILMIIALIMWFIK